MEQLAPFVAIKRFMEQKDAISPSGGRIVTMEELKALPYNDKMELAALAAERLGVTLKP